jgi:hypothetical protein
MQSYKHDLSFIINKVTKSKNIRKKSIIYKFIETPH